MSAPKPKTLDPKAAVVVLSGGQDSTTCLYWALENFRTVHAVTFDYGQRHALEIESAKAVTRLAGVGSALLVKTGPVLGGSSPLVDHNRAVGHYKDVASLPGGLEDTFVPGRNIFFFTLAAAHAYNVGALNLVSGVCEEDFGGYPDCRRRFVDAMEAALTQGMLAGVDGLCDQAFTIHTPLMQLSKAESVKMAAEIPGCLNALAYSHTCYDGCYPPCPKNHASLLRAKGFAAADIADPLIQRAIGEGFLPDDYPVTGLVEGTPYEEGSIEKTKWGTFKWVPLRRAE